MSNAEPQHKQLGEQSIKDAAAAAIVDLQLDVEVKAVSSDGDNWCVQFTTEYSQFCDAFRDQFGKENSFELIREKVKRHILKQQQKKIRAGVRIRRGKHERPAPPESLFDTTVKTIEGIASQTAGVVGEVVHQASRLPETALKVVDEAAKAASTVASLPGQLMQSADQQPLLRMTVKSARKAKRKTSSSARKAFSKKARASKKPASRKVSSKKTSAKKAASKKKRSAAKSTARPVKKRGGTKKSAKRK